MQPDQFKAFAEYNRRMNQKLYAAAERLSEADRTGDKGAFFGSVQNTLQHIMVADLIWLRRFQSVPKLKSVLEPVSDYPEIQSLDETLFADFTALTKVRERLDQLLIAFANVLSSEILAARFRYKNLAGKASENILWVYVAHVFNHQTHHRGQTTTLLTQMGIDVGVTDFPFVITEA